MGGCPKQRDQPEALTTTLSCRRAKSRLAVTTVAATPTNLWWRPITEIVCFLWLIPEWMSCHGFVARVAGNAARADACTRHLAQDTTPSPRPGYACHGLSMTNMPAMRSCQCQRPCITNLPNELSPRIINRGSGRTRQSARYTRDGSGANGASILRPDCTISSAILPWITCHAAGNAACDMVLPLQQSKFV